LKVLFMGTPVFAVPSLKALLNSRHTITAVVSQPDRPSGRGLTTRATPVKEAALEAGLQVIQPRGVRSPRFFETIKALSPDLLVVVAFGRILPLSLLQLPPEGAVNVHSSLLPRYRGAAPAAWAIARGEEVTGVTTMRIVEALDAGDILLQRSTPIGPEETTAQLEERLAVMGARLLVETVDAVAEGTIASIPQDENRSTYAPLIKKEDGLIDWAGDAVTIGRRVRAFVPWPVTYTSSRGKRIRIWKARPVEGELTPGEANPGVVLYAGKAGLKVGCGGGSILELLEVQPDGKKRMPAADAVAGRYFSAGDILGKDSVS
jgi:methionyl-tRNA formyltransferase